MIGQTFAAQALAGARLIAAMTPRRVRLDRTFFQPVLLSWFAARAGWNFSGFETILYPIYYAGQNIIDEIFLFCPASTRGAVMILHQIFCSP
jgi:hypothetical protein